MTRPDPNNADATLSRVAHSDYIWVGVRMASPDFNLREAYDAMPFQSKRSASVAVQSMMRAQLVTSPYTQGRAPGVAS